MSEKKQLVLRSFAWHGQTCFVVSTFFTATEGYTGFCHTVEISPSELESQSAELRQKDANPATPFREQLGQSIHNHADICAELVETGKLLKKEI